MTPEYDTYEWQQLRNAKLMEWIGDPHAVDFIRYWGGVCELWDDLVDNDKIITRNRVDSVFWTILTELPLNPFFDRYKHQLIPILVTGINAWQDSNELEKGTVSDKMFAYVLRDWCREFICYVVYLTRGREYLRSVSMEIRKFFTGHETIDQYMEKLP